LGLAGHEKAEAPGLDDWTRRNTSASMPCRRACEHPRRRRPSSPPAAPS